jgi:hypothetical protein
MMHSLIICSILLQHQTHGFNFLSKINKVSYASLSVVKKTQQLIENKKNLKVKKLFMH